MTEVETLAKIQAMSIDEKIAALSPTDKAYIKGYIERAVMEKQASEKRKKKSEKRGTPHENR
jgi:uncharacterized protein YaiI (UPF0178 family)